MNWVSLTQTWSRIRASYWFVPTIMVLGAMLLSFLTGLIDARIGTAWPESIGFLFDSRPEGARSVLSAIAGSMITVAGVTFSTTMVSVSFASGHFGPRLIGNFMRDTGNQVTLGVFIATFVYCLMILRSVRGAALVESQGVAEVFVPQLSVLVAIALALACVGVLIFFIHHVPETINVGRIIADIGDQLRCELETMFPKQDPEVRTAASRAEESGIEGLDWQSARALSADSSGYVQAIDLDSLVLHAIEQDLVLRLEFRPGDFANAGDVLLLASPAERCSAERLAALREQFAIGLERTPRQNALFLVDQLVELIARALSPGTNDPYTAINCINWLGSALVDIVDNEDAEAHRRDQQGQLRLVAHPVSFERFVSGVFDRSGQYVASDRNACLEMMKMIAEVAVRASKESRRSILLHHASELKVAALERLPLEKDRREVAERLEWIQKVVADPEARRRLRDDQGWFGGSA